MCSSQICWVNVVQAHCDGEVGCTKHHKVEDRQASLGLYFSGTPVYQFALQARKEALGHVSAAITKSLVIRSPKAQPTTLLLQKSTTTAKYENPTHVGTWVMSAAHIWLTPVAVSWRLASERFKPPTHSNTHPPAAPGSRPKHGCAANGAPPAPLALAVVRGQSAAGRGGVWGLTVCIPPTG
jgi:hypothetical protein